MGVTHVPVMIAASSSAQTSTAMLALPEKPRLVRKVVANATVTLRDPGIATSRLALNALFPKNTVALRKRCTREMRRTLSAAPTTVYARYRMKPI